MKTFPEIVLIDDCYFSKAHHLMRNITESGTQVILAILFYVMESLRCVLMLKVIQIQ